MHGLEEELEREVEQLTSRQLVEVNRSVGLLIQRELYGRFSCLGFLTIENLPDLLREKRTLDVCMVWALSFNLFCFYVFALFCRETGRKQSRGAVMQHFLGMQKLVAHHTALDSHLAERVSQDSRTTSGWG